MCSFHSYFILSVKFFILVQNASLFKWDHVAFRLVHFPVVKLLRLVEVYFGGSRMKMKDNTIVLVTLSVIQVLLLETKVLVLHCMALPLSTFSIILFETWNVDFFFFFSLLHFRCYICCLSASNFQVCILVDSSSLH